MKLIYNGKIEKGKLKLFNQAKLRKEIKIWDNKNVYIAIYLRRKTRSLMQNSYYFAVVVPIVQEALNNVGYKVTKDDTHDYLRGTFGKDELVNDETGEVLETRMSTAKMSTVRFMEYIADIQQWAAEYLNTVIPDPEEQTKMEFTDEKN